jgi:hypothetical protein
MEVSAVHYILSYVLTNLFYSWICWDQYKVKTMTAVTRVHMAGCRARRSEQRYHPSVTYRQSHLFALMYIDVFSD